MIGQLPAPCAYFGPHGRFALREVCHNGLVIAFDLYDAARTGPDGRSQCVGRHTYATEAFDAAARLLPEHERERTQLGQSFWQD